MEWSDLQLVLDDHQSDHQVSYKDIPQDEQFLPRLHWSISFFNSIELHVVWTLWLFSF